MFSCNDIIACLLFLFCCNDIIACSFYFATIISLRALSILQIEEILEKADLQLVLELWYTESGCDLVQVNRKKNLISNSSAIPQVLQGVE